MLDIKDQIRFMSTCSYFYHCLKIYELTYKTENNQVLYQNKYNELKYLNIVDNQSITSVHHQINSLHTLLAANCKRLQIDKFVHRDNVLKILDITNIIGIHDVSMFTHLEELYADFTGITQKGIMKINPKIVYLENNEHISDISHLTYAENIDITDCSLITQQGIKNINPTTFRIYNNHNVYDLTHMTNLRHLYIGDCDNITVENISKLENLETLDISNENIGEALTKLVNLKSLFIIRADLTQEHIQNLENLESLEVNNGTCDFSDISHMKNLTYLVINDNIFDEEYIKKQENINDLLNY